MRLKSCAIALLTLPCTLSGILGAGIMVGGIVGDTANAQSPPAKVTTEKTGTDQAATPAPLPALTQALIKRLQDKKLDATTEERQAASLYYEANPGKTLWVDLQGQTPGGKALVAELNRAETWGLSAADFDAAKLTPPTGKFPETDMADLEVRATLAAMKYARFARGGRITDPTAKLASYIDRKPQLLAPAVVLDTLASAPAPDTALAGFNPQHAGFLGLKKVLADLRAMPMGAPSKKKTSESDDNLDPGPSLRPGTRNWEVAVVRRWLKVTTPVTEGKDGGAELLDQPLVDAVIAFQTAQGLEPADGIIGNKTRAALNSTRPPSEKAVLANMEQWRWMPADLGDIYVTVNIPEYTLRVVKKNGTIHTERVVTGLPTNQTPIFSDAMQTVVMNPDWILPESIKVNEALPSLTGRGGDMFWKNGLKVKRGNTEVDPKSVNWYQADVRHYTFYQPPGEANVLGQVKFLFPNKHAVYMHDTPSKSLFEKSERAFSHGCMRVRNPIKLAELVLMHDKGWSAEKVDALIEDGPEDNKILLDHRIAVHVTYFTVAVDETGAVKQFPDVYGHEQRIKLALDGKWGEIDIPDDHLAPIEDREFEPRVAVNERRRDTDERSERRGGGRSGGGSEFERALKNIFGGF
jgi:L,D-transpeptidase YcbB